MAAAIQFFQFQTWYVSLPAIALIVFAILFVLLGTLYGGGAIRGETYAGCAIALAIVFAVVLAASAGLYLFLRVTRRL